MKPNFAELPESYETLRRAAKSLLKGVRLSESEALDIWNQVSGGAEPTPAKLAEVQHAIAKHYGFATWAALKTSYLAQTARLTPLDEWARQIVKKLHGEGWERPQPKRAGSMIPLRPELSTHSPLGAVLCSDLDSLMRFNPTPDGEFEVDLLCVACALPGLSEEQTPRAMACARWLLDRGFAVNRTSGAPMFEGVPMPPLYYAAGVANSPELTAELLARGAEPNDNESLYHSMEFADTRCTELLLKAGAKPFSMVIFRALDFADPARIQVLLDHGADPNARGHDQSPMHWGLKSKCPLEVFRLLLEAGADPTSQDGHGNSARELAIWLHRNDVVELIDEHRGVSEEPTRSEEEAYVLAVMNGRPASRPTEPLSGRAVHVLPLLARHGDLVAARRLLEAGWPADASEPSLGSALNHAAFSGDPEMAKLLLEFGANWAEKNAYGGDAWGSVYWASRNLGTDAGVGRHVEVARVFLEAGSPVPDVIDASEEVEEFLDAWLAEHPDWPRAELS